jgi:hypothetical protein
MSHPSWTVVVGQVHRRQQAHHGPVRAVDQQPVLEAAFTTGAPSIDSSMPIITPAMRTSR